MVELTIPQALHHATQHQQAGRLSEAEHLCRNILAADPRCLDALRLMGVIALQAGRPDVMPAIHDNLGLALIAHGRFEEAVASFHQAIALQPDYADAHNNLGNLLKERGQVGDAIACLQRAIALRPGFAAAHNNLGAALLADGRLDEAASCFARAAALQPDFAVAHYNLGSACRKQGRLDEAIACYRQALTLNPGLAPAYHNLGSIFAEQDRHHEAMACYRQAAALNPNAAETELALGVSLLRTGSHEEAMARFQRALALNPRLAAAHNNLGSIFQQRGQQEEALASYQQAIAIDPHRAETHNNLGTIYRDRRQFDDALACFRRAIALDPNHAEALDNLGVELKARGQLDPAMECFRRAIALKPEHAGAHNNLGNTLKNRGELDEALAALRQALILEPNNAETHSNLILTLHYRHGDQAEVIEAELRRWNEQHSQPLGQAIPAHSNDRSPTRRLRIGYLSPDFKSHPVGWFLRPLFAAHDRQSFEWYCYSNAPHADAVTAQLRSHVDGWSEISTQTDQQVADQIRKDRIDILVDLALHTAKNRLLVFALKPAPIQATYLAYAGNSGLNTIDYRITDSQLDPHDHRVPPGAEQPFRLPENYWCYQPLVQPPPAVTSLPALAAGHVTFGCLNNFCKVTPATLAAWCRLLVAVPNAQLLLHSHPGTHRQRLQNLFIENRLDPRRLRFQDFAPITQYLEAYQSIDIALDPFPFCGGTTTCDALWMGVPVITLAGPTPVTRGGLSLLSNVGLPELAAHSVDAYVEKAAALAADLPRLAALRAGLRERLQRSPIMDAPRFARHLESAYRTMWRRWCAQPASAPAR